MLTSAFAHSGRPANLRYFPFISNESTSRLYTCLVLMPKTFQKPTNWCRIVMMEASYLPVEILVWPEIAKALFRLQTKSTLWSQWFCICFHEGNRFSIRGLSPLTAQQLSRNVWPCRTIVLPSIKRWNGRLHQADGTTYARYTKKISADGCGAAGMSFLITVPEVKKDG